MSKKKYVKKIIHPTDPNYLDAFYRGWGAGQSVTQRQTPRSEDGQAEMPPKPARNELLGGDK